MSSHAVAGSDFRWLQSTLLQDHKDNFPLELDHLVACNGEVSESSSSSNSSNNAKALAIMSLIFSLRVSASTFAIVACCKTENVCRLDAGALCLGTKERLLMQFEVEEQVMMKR